MRAATFNVLADAYIGYGDYSHVEPSLLAPKARTDHLVNLINDLDADIVGLQEVEAPLVEALRETGNWQAFWTSKERGKADGCLTLVKPNLEVNDFETHAYSDGSGHIAQIVRLGKIAYANTHIKWAPSDSVKHIGVGQAKELLDMLGDNQHAVIFADSNDRPNGPVRQLVEEKGFTDVFGDMPTALVDRQAVAIDLLAVRGLSARRINRDISVLNIPNRDIPSDHIPLVADIDLY